MAQNLLNFGKRTFLQTYKNTFFFSLGISSNNFKEYDLNLNVLCGEWCSIALQYVAIIKKGTGWLDDGSVE